MQSVSAAAKIIEKNILSIIFGRSLQLISTFKTWRAGFQLLAAMHFSLQIHTSHDVLRCCSFVVSHTGSLIV